MPNHIPALRSLTLERLAAFESRNVTFIDPDGSWPIVWARAQGTKVWDERGRKYTDFTAAFGVAAAGHANPRVVRAASRQMRQLLHAMGDVHPHPLKADLARKLSQVTFERWTRNQTRGKTIFCNSGFEAVEAALKTARLASGQPGVIAFTGAYHGLGYGALNATHRQHFRSPFRDQLRQFARFAPYPPAPLDRIEFELRRALARGRIGAVLVEPIQARGGMHVPPVGFLPLLRRLCDEFDALLILDEVYTGFGRTGAWFACEHTQTVPDLICLGKALTGGFPLSACVGRADLMDRAWPPSTGEAIHTSTFLGHPVGCAMALAQIDEIARLKLPERSAALGAFLLDLLRAEVQPAHAAAEMRGQGLFAGVDLRDRNGRPATRPALEAIKTLLGQGYILLPEGPDSNVISFTPPLTISRAEITGCVRALSQVLA